MIFSPPQPKGKSTVICHEMEDTLENTCSMHEDQGLPQSILEGATVQSKIRYDLMESPLLRMAIHACQKWTSLPSVGYFWNETIQKINKKDHSSVTID